MRNGRFVLFILCVACAGPASAQFNFELLCRSDTIQVVPPTHTAVFGFSLSNTGPLQDTYGLEVPLEADSFPSDEWVSFMRIGGVFVPSRVAHIALVPGSVDTAIEVHICTYSVYPSWGTGKTMLLVSSLGDLSLRDSVGVRVVVSEFTCGDVNGDGSINVADATYLVSFVYRSGPEPLGWADVNLDGRVTIADATYIIAHIYRGGPSPCEPNLGGGKIKHSGDR